MIRQLKETKKEELKVYLFEGKMYVIISKLAEALNASKSDVYNASARLGKENVAEYVKIIPIQDNARRATAKCICLDGVHILFKKIERKVDSFKLKEVAEFLNVDLNLNESARNGNIVEFKPNNIEDENTNTDSLEEPTTEVSTNLEDSVNIESSLDAEDIMNGILNIIEENKELKNKVVTLENEVATLQEKIENSLEIDSLKKENEILKEKLKSSEEKNMSLLNKANLIKKYIQSNK